MTTALINGRVLQSAGFVEGLAVLVHAGKIVDVLPATHERARGAAPHDLHGQLLLPGFIDTQVNGGGGVLFNDNPGIESIRAIGQAHRRFGTTGFLPTLISDDLHVVENAIAGVQAAIDAGVPGVLGIHIEGPFLNVQRKGVHDATKLRELDETAIKLLTSLHGGKTLITLAPEMTTPDIIRKLAGAGMIVSAGHSNGTYADIRAALDNGLSGFTHLFNAMSQLTGREPGVVGAALDDQKSWCGIILDGLHVDPVVLRIALRSKPHDRFMLVTDAMPSVGIDGDEFMLQGRRIVVRDGKCLDEAGTLAGSHLNMAEAIANAARLLDIDLAQAVRMASQYPAAFLGLDNELGKIQRGYRASFVVADDEMNVIETWIDGVRADQSSLAA
ncbi:N-acetylglucosamine-6-phosphate deacetylase [Povalibacter uvarum]|uniref:N-acetylglucosamine-6-phosphate deacetylase n=1 Tax=Povalibacter uvarum TaxID=732238 RepID=A0A841HT48_9GAMM|nr:N-acetylglucosamine-6-phosphate deacetylase [Povalibacter uvarum]MBB6095953.1 N-acetylglucosamine-6-phosphate deacetylase [Povalibacter uvarum]